LPPTTAAFGEGFRIEFYGMMRVIGIKQPELSGIYVFNNDRKQYNTALLVIDEGALVLPITYYPVPLKSKIACFLFRSIVNLRHNGVPSSIYYTFDIE
jgi:hypothetical protein